MTKVVLNKRVHQVRVRDLPVVRGTTGEASMAILEKNKKGLDARAVPVAEVYRLLQQAWQDGYNTCRGEFERP